MDGNWIDKTERVVGANCCCFVRRDELCDVNTIQKRERLGSSVEQKRKKGTLGDVKKNTRMV